MKVFRNLYWAVVGKVVTLLGSLIVGIFVARYLGPEQYGLMNYIISYVLIFQTLATFGLDNIEIREESRSEQERDVIIGTAFTLKCIFALITMLAVTITAFIFESDRFTQVMIGIYSFTILLNSFSVIRNHFTSLVWNEYVVKTEIYRTFIGIGLKVILLLVHAPLMWFILAILVDTSLLASGYCVAYRTKIDKLTLWRFDKQWAKYLLAQAFPLLLSGAAVIIYQRIDQIMIGNMIDKENVGYFSVASKFVEVLIFIPTILAQTISPILVRIREQSQEEYEHKAQFFMNITLWLCILMAIVVSLISYPLIVWTFGKQYLPAVSILQTFAFKAASVALSSTAGQMIVIEKLQKYSIIRDAFGCIICILLNLWLLPKYGVIAAAVVAIISNIAAGYIADLLVPQYWHLFRRQTMALFLGWKDLIHIKQLIK